MHSYQAESDIELNLSVGDYVVVRKVYNLIEHCFNCFAILSQWSQGWLMILDGTCMDFCLQNFLIKEIRWYLLSTIHLKHFLFLKFLTRHSIMLFYMATVLVVLLLLNWNLLLLMVCQVYTHWNQ